MAEEILGLAEIEVRAKLDNLDRDLNQALSKTEAMTKEMANNINKLGSLIDFAGPFGKALVGLKAFKTGIETATGVIRLFKGDTEGAVEAFEKIPLIGRNVIKPLHEMYNEITGAKEATEQLKKETQSWEESVKGVAKAYEEARKIREGIAVENEKDPVKKAQLKGDNDIAEKKRAIDEQIGALLQAHNKKENDALPNAFTQFQQKGSHGIFSNLVQGPTGKGKDSLDPTERKTLTNLETQRAALVGALKEKTAADVAKAKEEADKKEQEEIKKNGQEIHAHELKIAEEEKKLKEKNIETEENVRQALYEARGQHLNAEVEQVRNHYNKLIREADAYHKGLLANARDETIMAKIKADGDKKADEEKGIGSTNKELRLKLGGNVDEAEKQAIKDKYDLEIKQAERAQLFGKAKLLQEQESLELAKKERDIKQKHEEEAFNTRQRTLKLTDDPKKNLQAKLEAIDEEAKKKKETADKASFAEIDKQTKLDKQRAVLDFFADQNKDQKGSFKAVQAGAFSFKAIGEQAAREKPKDLSVYMVKMVQYLDNIDKKTKAQSNAPVGG